MIVNPRRARRLVVAAAIAGMALRLAFSFLYWVGKPLTHDEREYLDLARSLSSGHGFVYSGGTEAGTTQQFGRAPGYPLFLAITGAGRSQGDVVPVTAKVSQAIAGAITVWLIGLFALRSAGSAAAVLASWTAAVYPPLVWICAYVFSEALYSVLALGAALLLQAAYDRSRQGGALLARGQTAIGSSATSGRVHLVAALAGLVAGAAILVRPAMIFYLPLVLLWLGLRRRVLLALVFLLTCIAVVTPWTVRNMRVYGHFVLVASEGGVTFWTGNHPLAKGEGDLAANPAIKAADLEFRRAHPGLTADQLEPLYYRDALHYIAAHPVWWTGLVARKLVYTVLPIGPSYTLHSSRYWLASIVSYLLVLPFGIAGAVRLVRDARVPAALFLLAASAVLVSLVFFPQERFRIPVIDPVLIVCAGALAVERQT
jgi:4-amino-4-deoxy-L-arabinose transferase-like glycosyltransferase